jgi:hypothetical protein
LFQKLNLLDNEAVKDKSLCSIQCTRYIAAATPVSSVLVKERTMALLLMDKDSLKKIARKMNIVVCIKNKDGKSRDMGKNEIIRNIIEGEVLPTMNSATAAVVPRQQPSCTVRLINVIMHDSIYNDFLKSRTQASRVELDNGEVGSSRTIWDRVHEAFLNGVDEDFDVNVNWVDVLHFDHPSGMFEKIDPATVIPHSKEKLFQMWKKLQSDYKDAVRKHTKSGNHSSSFCSSVQKLDFSGRDLDDGEVAVEGEDPEGMEKEGFLGFIGNNSAILYLRMWINVRGPSMNEFVHAKMPRGSTFDSGIDSTIDESDDPEDDSNNTKRGKKDQLIEVLKDGFNNRVHDTYHRHLTRLQSAAEVRRIAQDAQTATLLENMVANQEIANLESNIERLETILKRKRKEGDDEAAATIMIKKKTLEDKLISLM